MNNYYQYSPYYGNQNPYLYSQNQPTQIPYNQPQSQPTLYGKIVDSIENVKAQDLPIGMTGIYPAANGEIIYSKEWLSNGTTQIKEYRIYEEPETKEYIINWGDRFDEIYKCIDDLGKKIDKINKPATTTTSMKRKAGSNE